MVKNIILIMPLFFLLFMPVSWSVLQCIEIAGKQIRNNDLIFIIILLLIGYFLTLRKFLIINKIENVNFDFKYRKKYEFYYKLFLLYNLFNIIFHAFNNSSSIVYMICNYLIIFFPYLYYKLYSNFFNIYNKFINKLFILIGSLISLQIVLLNFYFNYFAKFFNWNINIDRNNLFIRANTTIGSATVTGQFLFFIFVIAFVNYLKEGKKINLFFLFLITLSIFLTRTRSSILAYFIFIIYSITIKGYKFKKMEIFFLIIILLIFSINIIYPLIESSINNRFVYISENQSIKTRIFYFENTFNYFLKEPILGKGLGNGYNRLTDIKRDVRKINNPHNQHIALLLETGIIGYILFILTIAYINIYYLKISNNRYIKYYLFSFNLLFLFCAQFETFFTSDLRTSILFGIMLVVLENESKYIVKNKN